MLQPSSAERLDTAHPDYGAAAAEVASSLEEHKCAVLKLDEQSIFQMDTAQKALNKVYELSTVSDDASQLGAAFKHSSGFVHHPEHEAAAPGSLVSLLSQVCLCKGLLCM